MELLPQLVPLFLCPPDQRGAYGSSIPPAAPSATPAPQPARLHASLCINLVSHHMPLLTYMGHRSSL